MKYLELIAINHTILHKQMKLKSINMWFIAPPVSVSHSVCAIMDLETEPSPSSVD